MPRGRLKLALEPAPSAAPGACSGEPARVLTTQAGSEKEQDAEPGGAVMKALQALQAAEPGEGEKELEGQGLQLEEPAAEEAGKQCEATHHKP